MNETQEKEKKRKETKRREIRVKKKKKKKRNYSNIRGAICVQTGRKKAPELRNAPTSLDTIR